MRDGQELLFRFLGEEGAFQRESGGVFDCQGRGCRLARGEIFFGAERRFLEEL